MVCGYLGTDVKRTADDLLRGESEARPEPEPDPRADPLAAFGAKLRGRGRKRKAEPALDSWEEVVPPEPEPASTLDPESEATEEHEFVVRETRRAGLHISAKTEEPSRSKRRPAKADVAEQETQETFAIAGVREVSTEEDVSDWGFDDDPADYSAAV